MIIRFLYSALLLILISATISFGQILEEEDAVVQTLESFQQAIISNDIKKAKEILSESARILEGGNIETKEEYLSHHFHSDGKFLSSMKREVESQNVSIKGNIAWISTKTHLSGNYNERKLDLNSLELAILKKEESIWNIMALHWSSAGRK